MEKTLAGQVKFLKKKSKNISDWYVDVILKSELADYGPTKGTIIFRPYGYKIWENIQKYLDNDIKEKLGALNCYFPLFVPENLLKREKTHIKSFSPELAVVTIAGGEKLTEPLIVRPTSETIMYETFSRWIQSYRDLPLKINQWVNVVRWEKRPYLFLRNTEFLWQEGHTAHAQHKESLAMVFDSLEMYQNCYQKNLAIYGIAGKKSESEKFAGADATYSYEMLMPDAKALQGCTSHDLGRNFSRVFNLKFLDRKGKNQYCWQTSWGLSTRSIGALAMVHGDDRGLILPPNIAPYKTVVIPIYDRKNNAKIKKYLERVLGNLPIPISETIIDDAKEHSPGFKFNQWELKGVPLRIEIGLKEVRSQSLTLVRRDSGQKNMIKLSAVKKTIEKLLIEIQKNLFEKSKKFTQKNIREAKTLDDFKEIMKTTRGFILANWCENEKCEKKLKDETKASTRCLPLDKEMSQKTGKCVYCGKKSNHRWLFAQAY
jgi:prolyl-tRNA synthetase